jgi:hypothetical protein
VPVQQVMDCGSSNSKNNLPVVVDDYDVVEYAIDVVRVEKKLRHSRPPFGFDPSFSNLKE